MIEAAFDTSSLSTYFCLRDNHKIIIDQAWQNAASEILTEIAQILQKNNYNFADIDYWLVGIGPGSFTGLRVGLSFVQGLCYDNKTQFLGVNSANLFLQDCPKSEVIIINDGRHQQVLVNHFHFIDNQWRQRQKIYTLPIEKLPAIINDKILLKTFMPIDKFAVLDQDIIKKIDFIQIESCQYYFADEVVKVPAKNNYLEPLYVCPAFFTNIKKSIV